MKKFLGIIIITIVLAFGSNAIAETQYNEKELGIGILYSSKDIYTFSSNLNGVIIGVSWNNWITAETRDAGTRNYGQTKIGNVEDMWGIDLGYSWKIHKYCRLGIEGSLLFITEYNKYRDYRFTEGYYLSETNSETKTGVGVIVGMPIHRHIELVISVNTIKGNGFGILYRF